MGKKYIINFVAYLFCIEAKKKIHKRVIFGSTKVFNFKLGVIAAVFMALAVYYINSKYGFQRAFIASMKQFTYSIVLSSFLAKMTENIAVSMKDKWRAIFTAVVSIALFTSILTYFLHSLKGTPEPFYSSIPTIATSPFALLFVALRKRNKFDKQQLELELAEI